MILGREYECNTDHFDKLAWRCNFIIETNTEEWTERRVPMTYECRSTDMLAQMMNAAADTDADDTCESELNQDEYACQ